eukprot:117104-Rhodomonas_salina.3
MCGGVVLIPKVPAVRCAGGGDQGQCAAGGVRAEAERGGNEGSRGSVEDGDAGGGSGSHPRSCTASALRHTLLTQLLALSGGAGREAPEQRPRVAQHLRGSPGTSLRASCAMRGTDTACQEEKEAQLSQCEARLAAQGGDQVAAHALAM